jgi:hypothetical protein
MPLSLDGQDRGSPAQLPPFSTGDALSPPRLSEGLGINPVVGPDRFSVFNISQDKPGFAFLLVTKPTNQVNSQVSSVLLRWTWLGPWLSVRTASDSALAVLLGLWRGLGVGTSWCCHHCLCVVVSFKDKTLRMLCIAD